VEGIKSGMIYDICNRLQLVVIYYGYIFLKIPKLKKKVLSNKIGISVGINHMEEDLVL
jgi:hypothetical protein